MMGCMVGYMLHLLCCYLADQRLRSRTHEGGIEHVAVIEYMDLTYFGLGLWVETVFRLASGLESGLQLGFEFELKRH